MNHEAMKQAFFDEYYVAPVEQAVQRGSCTLPRERSLVDRTINTIATTSLIAVLECLCTRELDRYIRVNDETPVATQMYCQQCAPVPVGSRVRMTGWVERLGGDGVTFRVKAQDEHEQVCDGQIQFAIVKRDQIEDAMSRKQEAIARRELFAPA
jgi:fluoroacetyl-CoA thioesterase